MRVPRQRTDARPLPAQLDDDHALVVGGGMAGLLAARVLADRFREVTLVERDHLVSDGRPRPGVPQGRHAHTLLPRGAEILERLFPGLLVELSRGGAPIADRLSQLHFSMNGHLLTQERGHDRHPLYEPSRPFLEGTVLARLRDLPNVNLLDGFEVVTLIAGGAGNVTGARVTRREPKPVAQEVRAQLVVAATGASGRAGAWLAELGYPRPPERSVDVDVGFATTLVRFAPGAMGPVRAVLIGPEARRPYGAVALAQEGRHWVVTLAGYAGQRPPTDLERWLLFADRVLPSQMAEALREAEVLDEVRAHHFSANPRRYYERLSRFPTGLLVMGDELCSLNPLYGQGMTVTALEAVALQTALLGAPDGLAHRFFKASAKPVGDAWNLAVGSDLAMPTSVVPGPRPLPVRVANAYLDRLGAAAENDPAVARRVLDVAGFDEPVRHLFALGGLRRVAADRMQRRRATVVAPGHPPTR